MLQFIQDNAVLCTCIVGVFTAVLSALVTLIVNRNTEKSKYISDLKADIKEAKSELQNAQEKLKKAEEELEKYKSVEFAEKNVDKSLGSIYEETLSNGSKRYICGFCWEKDHIKMPIVVSYYYDNNNQPYLGTHCSVCKGFCEENH